MTEKKKEKTRIWAAAIFAAGEASAFLLGQAGVYLLSGLCLIAAAAALFFVFYRRSGRLLDMEALFSLFWLGGAGVSCLKLSQLASPWALATWLCFGLVYVCFLIGYAFRLPIALRQRPGNENLRGCQGPQAGRPAGWPEREEAAERTEKRLGMCVLVTTGISLACFLLEAAVLGFLPILSDKPHAYSEFHISGVHYFTVSCVLVPALALLYYYQIKKRKETLSGKQWGLVFGCSAIAFLIPILCVSRFQLIFALALAVMVWIQVSGRVKLKYILILAAVMIPLYVGLTVARNHDVAYLNGIFEMKNENTPIFVTQPYMYIANNYDNFNCLVEELPAHTHGLRMAYPLIVFSGMKFAHPEWVNFPLYVTKTELTTVTILYDAYYDFGIFGVALFGFLLGLFCRWMTDLRDRFSNPVGYLFYAQAAMYLVLSFFTTWYSNPTTWFWYGVTFLCYLTVTGAGKIFGRRSGMKERREEGEENE